MKRRQALCFILYFSTMVFYGVELQGKYVERQTEKESTAISEHKDLKKTEELLNKLKTDLSLTTTSLSLTTASFENLNS